MVDTRHLRGRKIAFRIQGMQHVYFGTVKTEETGELAGLWIEAPDLLAEAQQAYASTRSSGPLLAQFRTPVVFVPIGALQYLIAAEE
jgi:hypothetical protein